MSGSLFLTGLSGLRAAQVALVTTGHNTANVNTPGYSRQSATLDTAGGVQAGGMGYTGGGVRVSDVTRSHDSYLSSSLHQAESLGQALATSLAQMSQLDNLLADPQASLAPRLQTLFSHVQAVAATPADPAARQQLISSGEAVASLFRSMDAYMTGLGASLDAQLRGAVDQVNAYAGQIASLNRQVTLLGSATGGQAPNDLLDQRDQLVHELSKLVATRVVAQDGGGYNVFIGNGQSLVLGDRAAPLAAVPLASDPGRVGVALVNAAGRAVQVQESTLHGGLMGGLLHFRGQVLDPAHNALGRMAVGLADAFNRQHRQGVDLSGAAGGDFFSQAQPQVISHARNTGTLQLAVGHADTGALGTGDWKLQVRDNAGALSYALLRVPGDAAGAPVATFAASDFPVTFEGLTIGLGTGQAVAGDSFLIRPTRHGARDFSVRLTDPAQVAAAGATDPDDGSLAIGSGRVSDGRNALLLGALQNLKLLGGGTASFHDAYAQMVSTVGNQTRQMQIASDAQTSLATQIRAVQQSISGVNQDEETANLLMFQQMYQANAKVIQTATTLFDALLGIRS